MRIIHDIDYPCEVIAYARNNDVYAKRRDEDVSHGFPAEVAITGEDDVIHIEGDALFILQALKEACAMIERTGTEFVKKGVLSPDWNSFEAYEQRKAKLQADLALTRKQIKLPDKIGLSNNWFAYEVELKESSSIALVRIEQVDENMHVVHAAIRFDYDKLMFLDKPDDAWTNPSMESLEKLQDICMEHVE